jgi:hypothetical protein
MSVLTPITSGSYAGGLPVAARYGGAAGSGVFYPALLLSPCPYNNHDFTSRYPEYNCSKAVSGFAVSAQGPLEWDNSPASFVLYGAFEVLYTGSKTMTAHVATNFISGGDSDCALDVLLGANSYAGPAWSRTCHMDEGGAWLTTGSYTAPPFQFTAPFYRWVFYVSIVFVRFWPEATMGDSVTVTVV